MQAVLPLAVALIYALVLFAFASWAEGTRNIALKGKIRSPAYALALAVYCTSWTFYGAVGSAVADGWSYLPIYLGPIFVFLFAHKFLYRLVDSVKTDGANSISEFIGGRFSNSQAVAALVTILALLGTIPYIALQLRSLGTTYALVSGSPNKPMATVVAATGLALFAMIYGTRRYEAAGRNDSVLFAVGIESVVKIGGLTLAGIAALMMLGAAPERALTQGLYKLSMNFAPSRIGADFFVIAFLSMAAIVCLPRQFYVMAIEAQSSLDIRRARWPFITYILATLLLVLPISAAGLALLPGTVRTDLYVLQLPLSQGMHGLALVVFLGGFSAATAMVLVETIALSTMVSNDLIAPFLLRSKRWSADADMGGAVLLIRRLVIAMIMAGAVGWALGIRDNERLASIGLVAFAAMSQFAPVLILAVMGSNRDALAAKAGLGVGLALWLYTLALPEVASPAFLARLAGSPINPNALLGIDGLSPISHGTLWSLGGNLVAYVLMTMRRMQPVSLPNFLYKSHDSAGTVSTVRDLKNLVARFVGQEVTEDAFTASDENKIVDRVERRRAERMIASVVGMPSARALLGSALHGSNLTHREVARILDDTGQSLRFSKGLLAATLENIDPGVSVVDRELNLVAWNRRYLELFDYPPGMVRVGAPIADLIRYNAERGECGPGEVEAHVEKRLEHMRRGHQHDFKRARSDGKILKTVGGPMPSGGYVMCYTDVTAEEEAMRALDRARSELEARVEERTSALRAANDALAQADAEKTRFLAAASHDLLQPLHAARLFSAALGRELSDRPLQTLHRLDRSIQSAEALLRALLDISKLDAGGVKPEIHPIQLCPLLVELVETMMPLAREKGLDIRVGPGDAVVESDPGLLRSVIQNYLSNAIRYTDKGGILVGVRHRGSSARIDVIDTGPGIPKDKQELIFREFERLKNANEGGIGLGLAIVERTARLLGARVSVRSREGRGSRFSLSITRSSMTPLAKYTASSDWGERSRELTILIVDDDETNRAALGGYLNSCGHKVLTADTPENALMINAVYDIGLIDYNLNSDDDGITLIHALRAKSPAAHYALVTAAQESEYSKRTRKAGIKVLRKPLAPEELDNWFNEISLPAAAE